MNLTVTVRELMDQDAWHRACEMLGMNPRAVSDGVMAYGDRVTLSLGQVMELRLRDATSLSDDDISALRDEHERLMTERAAADTRIAEISRTLVAWEGARLRALREGGK